MITKNYKRIAAASLVCLPDYVHGNLPVRTTAGQTCYFGGVGSNDSFPATASFALVTGGTGLQKGIAFGSGTTTPTEDDYRIETPITSGLSAVNSFVVSKTEDENGNPTLSFSMMLTNTSEQPITITEVAYTQTVRVAGGIGSTYVFAPPICMDRTLLDSPVTIQPGDIGCIKYSLKVVVIS